MKGPRRSLVAVGLVLLVAAAFAGGYAAHRSPSSTTVAPTTSTTSNTTWMALWPSSIDSTRFATPRSAALDFATHILKMAHPLAGAFQQGDTRSGEVPLQSSATGPLTTVLVRQLTADNSWWVIGAVASDIEISTPAALSTVSSPVDVGGRSTAYEAVVNLSLYRDGSRTPLATGTVMGGSMGVMGPFSASLHYSAGTGTYGDLVVFSRSAKDGSVLEASAIRLRLG